MPLPEALSRLVEDRAFWTGEPGTPADGRPEIRLSLPVQDGYGLVLDVDPATGERTLGLRRPSASEPVQLGWAPAAGPYPAALRWWELDLCARVIALADPTLPHPGPVMALLSPFAPATPEDDEHEVAAVREAAYRALRRDVPPAPGPEQDPLPLFAGDRWWPRPSPQVLDEAAIALLTAPAAVRLEVRADPRFPREDLDALVRGAARELARQAEDRQWAVARPLARVIADSGDLSGVPELLGLLTEAGCDHPTVLDALSEPLVPAEACWMVETLAGAAPGTLLRRRA